MTYFDSKTYARCYTDVIKDIRELGTDYQRKVQAESPVFVDSSGVEGIQIADAVGIRIISSSFNTG